MLNGYYENKTKFYFGRDTEINISNEIPRKSKVLLVYGRKSFLSSSLREKVLEILKAAKVKTFELGGVKPNPTADLVYEGIKICKKNRIEHILAIGGGSVIDTAKAVSIGACYKNDFSDFYNNLSKAEKSLKLGIILTNCGSGSETSDTSVITFPEMQSKLAYSNKFMRADYVIMNPENTLSVPIHTTICGIIDSITHVFERYFSSTSYVDCSDRLSEGLILTLMKYAKLIKSEPGNYDYRAEIMWSCKMATDHLIYMGRKQDWACHLISHEIAALNDKAHAEILSVLYPKYLTYVANKRPDMLKQFAKRIFNTESVDDAIAKFKNFLIDLGMPTEYKEIGFTEIENIEKVAEKLSKVFPSGTIGNFVYLGKNDIINILTDKLEK